MKNWSNLVLEKNLDSNSKTQKLSQTKQEIKTKIQISLQELESPFLKKIIESLDKEIIWQQEAKREVAEVIISRLNSIKPQKGPLWVLFFSGPTWVWKTQTVKALSKVLFWYDSYFIKIACENLQQSFTSSNLFWAPKWYVWYWEKNLLDPNEMWCYYDSSKKAWKLHESVKNIDWFNIILFDEIEKAHPDVIQQLLSALDDWKVKNSKWEHLNFSNSIIIFTSNLWQRSINKAKAKTQIWFVKQDKTQDLEDIFQEELKKHFSPEFIWRVHNFIDFKWLDLNNCKQIIKKSLDSFNKTLQMYYPETYYHVSISESMYEYIIKNWFSWEKWARDLIRFYTKVVEDNISSYLNSKNFEELYEENTKYFFYIDIIDWKIDISLEMNNDSLNHSETDEETDEENENIQWILKLVNFENMSLDNILELFTIVKNYSELYYLQSIWEVDISKEVWELRESLLKMGLSNQDIKKLKNKSNLLWLNTTILTQLSTKVWNDFWTFENKVILKIVKNVLSNYIWKKIKDESDELLLDATSKVFELIEKLLWKELTSKQTMILNNMIKSVVFDNYDIQI